MLSGVSHDLRTPSTRLKLGLSLLPKDEATPLVQHVDEMQSLLDAFLEFSRCTADSSPESVDPENWLSQIINDAQRATCGTSRSFVGTNPPISRP